jgi:hypothetical protein
MAYEEWLEMVQLVMVGEELSLVYIPYVPLLEILELVMVGEELTQYNPLPLPFVI